MAAPVLFTILHGVLRILRIRNNGDNLSQSKGSNRRRLWIANISRRFTSEKQGKFCLKLQLIHQDLCEMSRLNRWVRS